MKDKVKILLKYLSCANEIKWNDIEKMIKEINFDMEDFFCFLEDPCENPYGRKMVYHSPKIECLLMSCSNNKSCLQKTIDRQLFLITVEYGGLI